MDGCDRVAERDTRLQVEGDRGRGKHPLMIDYDRRRLDSAVDQSAKRHFLSAGRIHVDAFECVGAVLEPRIDFENDVILIDLREYGRDDALAEGIVERVVDGRREDAEA